VLCGSELAYVAAANVYGCVPIFSWSAVALSDCLRSFAHFAKSSCADVALSSRCRRIISFRIVVAFAASTDVDEMGSLL
jgi:hypothetical protein